jgi:hypothetical protein
MSDTKQRKISNYVKYKTLKLKYKKAPEKLFFVKINVLFFVFVHSTLFYDKIPILCIY